MAVVQFEEKGRLYAVVPITDVKPICPDDDENAEFENGDYVAAIWPGDGKLYKAVFFDCGKSITNYGIVVISIQIGFILVQTNVFCLVWLSLNTLHVTSFGKIFNFELQNIVLKITNFYHFDRFASSLFGC